MAKSTPRSAPDLPELPPLGKKIQRLRKAYNLTLNELSEQSGVAKSIISQLEKNETNPTLSTMWRLSCALNTPLDEVLRCDECPAIIEQASSNDIPIL